MKKIWCYLLLLSCFIILTGCNNSSFSLKTEFEMNEKAIIDDIEITMIDANIISNNILEVIFEINNKRDNTISIASDTSFKLFDINQVQIPNQYQNDTNIIKSKETIHYTLNYSVNEKNIYEILFYSGVVENNIKFTITNLDLE